LVEKSILTIPILDALRKHENGCPLCHLWKKDEAEFMEQVEANEASMDPSFRRRVVRSSGFCNRHTHELFRLAFSGKVLDGLGYAMYEDDVIGAFAESLKDIQSKLRRDGEGKTRPSKAAIDSVSSELERRVTGGDACPICEKLLDSDKTRVGVFLQMLGDEGFVAVLAGSGWLCLPHLASALDLARARPNDHGPTVDLLIRVELDCLRKVDGHLKERIRKYSWDARNETLSAEQVGAQETGMRLIAGVDGLYCRTRKVPHRLARNELDQAKA
jgi:hypothetical protein